MSDAESELDTRWLLARSRGEPEPEIPAERAEQYRQLEALFVELPRLPARPVARPGWKERAREALQATTSARQDEAPAPVAANQPSGTVRDMRSRRRLRWSAAFGVALTAAAVLIIIRAVRPGELPHASLAITVEAGQDNRGGEPAVGDAVVVRARGVGELRIYDGNGVEQARCGNAGPPCKIERRQEVDTLVLTMSVNKPGILRVVRFSAPLTGASSGMDGDVAAAVRAGIDVAVQDPLRFR